MSVKSKTTLFRDLLYFKEVVAAQQISAAAEKNGIKPSNLSKIIQNLEIMTTRKLFKRSSRGFEPTSEALKLAELISNAEKSFDFCAQKLKRQNQSGILNLYLPQNLKFKNLKSFCQKNPDITLVFCTSVAEADVFVDYTAPQNADELICVQNNLGSNFEQSIWVCSTHQKAAVNLAQFIISEMHY